MMNRRDFIQKFTASLAGLGLAGKLVLLDKPILAFPAIPPDIQESLDFLNKITQGYLAPKYGCGIGAIAKYNEPENLWFRKVVEKAWADPNCRPLFEMDIKLSKMTREEQRYYYNTTPRPKWKELT